MENVKNNLNKLKNLEKFEINLKLNIYKLFKVII
jgi:hypothetical protein